MIGIYTTFDYSDFRLDNARLARTDKLNISVVVTNTGDRVTAVSGRNPCGAEFEANKGLEFKKNFIFNPISFLIVFLILQ